jgi:hypothetical protein
MLTINCTTLVGDLNSVVLRSGGFLRDDGMLPPQVAAAWLHRAAHTGGCAVDAIAEVVVLDVWCQGETNTFLFGNI